MKPVTKSKAKSKPVHTLKLKPLRTTRLKLPVFPSTFLQPKLSKRKEAAARKVQAAEQKEELRRIAGVKAKVQFQKDHPPKPRSHRLPEVVDPSSDGSFLPPPPKPECIAIPDPDHPEAKPIWITKRQFNYIRGLTSPDSPTFLNRSASREAAGYNRGSAGVERAPGMKRAIHVAMLKAGITDEKLAQGMSEGLDAMKTEIITFQGVVTDQVDMVDYGVRKQYIDMALQVRDDYPKKDQMLQTALILKIPPRATSDEEFEREFAVSTTVEVKGAEE